MQKPPWIGNADPGGLPFGPLPGAAATTLLKRVLAVETGDLQRLVHHAKLAEALEDIFGHALGKIDGAVGIKDLNPANGAAV